MLVLDEVSSSENGENLLLLKTSNQSRKGFEKGEFLGYQTFFLAAFIQHLPHIMSAAVKESQNV